MRLPPRSHRFLGFLSFTTARQFTDRSKFLFEPSGSAWDAVPGSQTNYFYLRGKALNWAENNVGSNAASQFWPYGQGSGVFATYQPDPSGFLYANRRYYNPILGAI